MIKTLILISGKKGYGKSYLSNTIKKMVDNDGDTVFYNIPLAEPLKKMVREFVGKELYEDFITNNKEVIRPLLQTTGQFFRGVDKNYWLKKWEENLLTKFNRYYNKNAVVVIDDVRFENELDINDYLLKNNCKIKFDNVIKVRIFSEKNKNLPPVDNDISEIEMDEIDDSKFNYVVSMEKLRWVDGDKTFVDVIAKNILWCHRH